MKRQQNYYNKRNIKTVYPVSPPKNFNEWTLYIREQIDLTKVKQNTKIV